MRCPPRRLIAMVSVWPLVLPGVGCLRPYAGRPLGNIIQPDIVLIPGGQFTMGKNGEADHSPAHNVRVDPFYMDKYEVTNAQYLKFVRETDARLPEFWGMKKYCSGAEFPNHPVVGVGWAEAAAYAEWTGKRLPTEAEWESAARAGLIGKDYPHGGELSPAVANYWQWDVLRPSAGGIVPVGSYPPNAYGLCDMAGNVGEWVADLYSQDYYQSSPERNPTGPKAGKFRVIRGGGWHSGPSCNRVYYRNALPPQWRDFNIGFRCAKDVPKESPGDTREHPGRGPEP